MLNFTAVPNSSTRHIFSRILVFRHMWRNYFGVLVLKAKAEICLALIKLSAAKLLVDAVAIFGDSTGVVCEPAGAQLVHLETH